MPTQQSTEFTVLQCILKELLMGQILNMCITECRTRVGGGGYVHNIHFSHGFTGNMCLQTQQVAENKQVQCFHRTTM